MVPNECEKNFIVMLKFLIKILVLLALLKPNKISKLYAKDTMLGARPIYGHLTKHLFI